MLFVSINLKSYFMGNDLRIFIMKTVKKLKDMYQFSLLLKTNRLNELSNGRLSIQWLNFKISIQSYLL